MPWPRSARNSCLTPVRRGAATAVAQASDVCVPRGSRSGAAATGTAVTWLSDAAGPCGRVPSRESAVPLSGGQLSQPARDR
jgi:hypothetical protein